MYKVLTRFPINSERYPYRTYREFDTLDEALAAAARLEKNTELQAIVELPDNSLRYVPLRLLELTA